MTAPPVGEAGEARSALPSFAMACSKTHSSAGRSESALFTRPEVSKVRCRGPPGVCVTGRLFNFTLFSHAGGQHNERAGTDLGAGIRRLNHDMIQSQHFAVHFDSNAAKATIRNNNRCSRGGYWLSSWTMSTFFCLRIFHILTSSFATHCFMPLSPYWEITSNFPFWQYGRPPCICASITATFGFLLPQSVLHLFIGLLISSSPLPFLLLFNILRWELLVAADAKSFSPLSNTPITLHNPAAWLRESRKSSLCLTWAHRLSPSFKPAQTEVFITEEEWAQKSGEEWMKR